MKPHDTFYGAMTLFQRKKEDANLKEREPKSVRFSGRSTDEKNDEDSSYVILNNTPLTVMFEVFDFLYRLFPFNYY